MERKHTWGTLSAGRGFYCRLSILFSRPTGGRRLREEVARMTLMLHSSWTTPTTEIGLDEKEWTKTLKHYCIFWKQHQSWWEVLFWSVHIVRIQRLLAFWMVFQQAWGVPMSPALGKTAKVLVIDSNLKECLDPSRLASFALRSSCQTSAAQGQIWPWQR